MNFLGGIWSCWPEAGSYCLKGRGRSIFASTVSTPIGGAIAVDAGFVGTIVQIMLFDLVFSLDSVITAVGVADHIGVMVAAIVFSMAMMLMASAAVAGFIERHESVRMLALSFLILIGMMLVADGFGMHIPRGYVYAAMGFSALVEMLNLLAARRRISRTRAKQKLQKDALAARKRLMTTMQPISRQTADCHGTIFPNASSNG